MALTEEQQEHWDEALKDAKRGVDWYAVSSDVLLAVADHLAEVEAKCTGLHIHVGDIEGKLVAERAKVARLEELLALKEKELNDEIEQKWRWRAKANKEVTS